MRIKRHVLIRRFVLIGCALCALTALAWGQSSAGHQSWVEVARAASAPFAPAATADYSCAGQNQIPELECQALVIFYNQTNGPGWQNNDGWLVTTTPCTWSGITCANGHVTELDKNGGGDAGPRLEGSIPAELGNLSELEKLDFRNNHLTG